MGKRLRRNIDLLDKKGHASPLLLLIIFLLVCFATLLVGGIIPTLDEKYVSPLDDYDVDFSKIPKDTHNNLQLKTFGLKKCETNAALDLLIDNSGSMSFGSKMDDLKNALRVLADNFPDNGVLALQIYSVETAELLPFDKLFGQSKPQFLQAVNLMTPLSATHSRDGFIFAKTKLDAGKPKFPKHKFAMVFISDGIPETGATNDICPGGMSGSICGANSSNGSCRCFDSGQDPTDIAAQIKASGVRIFTIAYTDNSDQKFDTLLKSMMAKVASSPSDAYVAPAGTQILNVLKQIKTKICQEG